MSLQIDFYKENEWLGTIASNTLTRDNCHLKAKEWRKDSHPDADAYVVSGDGKPGIEVEF